MSSDPQTCVPFHALSFPLVDFCGFYIAIGSLCNRLLPMSLLRFSPSTAGVSVMSSFGAASALEVVPLAVAAVGKTLTDTRSAALWVIEAKSFKASCTFGSSAESESARQFSFVNVRADKVLMTNASRTGNAVPHPAKSCGRGARRGSRRMRRLA